MKWLPIKQTIFYFWTITYFIPIVKLIDLYRVVRLDYQNNNKQLCGYFTSKSFSQAWSMGNYQITMILQADLSSGSPTSRPGELGDLSENRYGIGKGKFLIKK